MRLLLRNGADKFAVASWPLPEGNQAPAGGLIGTLGSCTASEVGISFDGTLKSKECNRQMTMSIAGEPTFATVSVALSTCNRKVGIK